jgi:multidrug efflux pump subunit AcrB
MLGVSIGELFNTLQVYLGSLYVNDFNRFGRTWQVNVQAAADYRKQVEDIKQLKIRNSQGAMVPLSTMASVRAISGPVMVVRYNMYPSTAINGNAAPGISSGQALAAMEQVTRQELPPTMRPEWTELALLQLQTGKTAMLVFVLAWYWCSWSWRPSTRAGPCPWPSFWSCPCACSARSRAWCWRTWTSTSSRRSASWCWSAWPARTPS